MRKILKKFKTYLNDERGDILQWLIVVVVTVTIAINIIPNFNSVAKNRNEKIINVFNSNDTIIE